MTGHTLLLAGATGSVGVEILRYLATMSAPRHRLWAMIRASDDAELAARWRRLVRCFSDDQMVPEDLPHWRPVRGNVELPDLGFDAATEAAVTGETTAIINSAANVGFMDTLDVYRRTNVEGLRNLLELGTRCRSLDRFAQVSSLYVAGQRRGPVTEGELEHAEGFATTGYQQSKYEGELLARGYMARLPISVYRLSLLMGRAQDGYVHDFGATHRYLQCVFRGICPILPAQPDCPLDFLPNDYSARQLTDLFFDHFKGGSTYQISAGRRSITAQRWMELTGEVFAQHSRPWQRGVFSPPDIVDWDHYRLYVDTALRIENEGLRKVTKILDSCSRELFYPKVFERTEVDRKLADPVPDYEEYYPKVLQYCIESRWGRQPRYERI
jgi:nucleoside-diphosphate-sugar epimerase